MQEPSDLGDTTKFVHQPAAHWQPQRPATASVDARQISLLSAINPVIGAANPVLMLVPSLRTATPATDLPTLRTRLIGMIKEVDAACLKLGMSDEQRHIARYALCTVVDETVQLTPWGGGGEWAQQSLLIHFFNENWGGEKFFQLLDRMTEGSSRYQHLLELFYVCLSLGFAGRFQLHGASGRQALTDVRERLHVLIRHGSGDADTTLATHWRGVSVEARRFKGFGVLGLVAGLVALVCLAVYAGYSYSLAERLDRLRLHQLSIKPPVATPVAVAPAPKPRLAQLLGPEIQAGLVNVRDLKLESTVTVLGETVFESGSAAPATAAINLLQRVAQALEQVEGQVQVTGHTDNVPTRTLRHTSNFELSRERANNVKALIASRLRDPARISAEGKGDAEPVAGNETPQGRAQNRRVEITLRVPSTFQ